MLTTAEERKENLEQKAAEQRADLASDLRRLPRTSSSTWTGSGKASATRVKSGDLWLDSEGEELATDLLQEAVKKWSRRDWNAYLTYLEKREGELKEALMEPKDYDRLLLQDYKEVLARPMVTEGRSRLTTLVNLLCQGMTEKQKSALFLRYIEELSPSEMALRLGISRAAARNHSDRASQKFQAKLSLFLKGCQETKEARLIRKYLASRDTKKS